MMDIRPIRNEADHKWALSEIAPYFENQPEPGTPEADRFDVLADLIEAYEDRHFSIDPIEPIDLIKVHMEATGRTQADLAVLFGSRPRASEVLGRKRALTLDMVHKLSTEWHIPADCLVKPYHLAAA